jgi:DNA-binding CsgD family transcriptional regulator
MAAKVRTAKAKEKPAREAARGQESAPDKVGEDAPTEKPLPVVVQGVTGLTIPEDRAQAIAAAHMAGMPIKEICRTFNCSHHTIAALIRNRPELLAAAREITANNWRTLAALGSASLIDRLPEMKDHALTVMAAIATEKAELLSGGATARIEIVAAPAADEWGDVVEGVIVEPVPTGNAGQTLAPKAPPAPAPTLPDRASGEQPLAFGPRYSDAVDIVPVFEPTGPGFLPPPPPMDGGGAGVRSSLRTSYPDSSDDSKIFHKSP